MESVTLGMDTGTAPDPRVPSDCNIAFLRRRAWAQSRDSWQESQSDNCGPQGPQQTQRDGEAQGPSEEPGQVPNKITSWLIECRTPLGASLDDQSASPNRGAPRNGCSFEDDLSLGAEANHLHSSNKNTQSCFDLEVDQKRSRFKEKGRSMNSTGSGKSSTVSSVSELLEMYEEDPEEILLNLGFGREEPDAASRVPSRFITNNSSARGIDVKVYLGAQLQRMELENPNYALTSRFRQIEVLTTVANEFFQLYSQVSGQPIKRIISRDLGGEGGEEGEEGGNELPPPPLKRSSSALNVAKFLKKTISKQNLLAAAAAAALPEAHVPNQHAQSNGHGASDHTNTNGHAHASSEQDSCSTDPDHRGEMVNQKHSRKKDSCPLATVTEEASGDGEADDSPEQNGTRTAADGEHQPESADLQSTNQPKCEGTEVVKEEEEEDKNMTSTPEKAPPNLVPLQLVQLRNENTDSFDMEEIQSNEDEAVPHKTSKATDLSRTVSQQSDSSGFAEEPSADSNSYLKVQESIDSCDSETTVTSHPSQDVATPIAVDPPVFDLPYNTEEETRLFADAHERSGSQEEDEHDQTSEQIPQYTAHHLPWNRPIGMQQDETIDEERVDSVDQTDAGTEPEITQSMSASEQEPQAEIQHPQNQSTLKQNPQHTQNQTESAAETEPPTKGADSEDWEQERYALLENPSSPVHKALKRAKRNQLGRARQWAVPQSDDIPQIPQRGQGRRRDGIPLQRSSSLPSSFLSPSRVMSSVKIQFGPGQLSCTQPMYSFKYTLESGGEEEEEEEEEQSNCLSTLIIKPSSSSGSLNQPRLPTEASVPPKPIPGYLMQSTCASRSSSPLPDWSTGDHAHFGSTQSVPDLCSSRPQPNHFQRNSDHQNQQNRNPGLPIFPYPNPAVQYLNSSPNPSPALNPTLQYPSRFPSYASLPTCLHQYNPSLIHHCSLTSLHQPTISTIQQPHYGSFSSLHQPSTFATPHNISPGNLRPGTPVVHQQSFNHPYGHQFPYHATPHSSRVASPYLDIHGYNTNPNLATQYPPLAPEHSLHTGHFPPAPGYLPGLDSTFGQGHNINRGFTPHALSSTEMQLRKVLHDIRGTVQSLSQNQANTPDGFNEHKAALSTTQSWTELQQKRQSLNLFRCQMMDLELSITRQQALVYNHLSPADRLEVEQLRSLRSSVREELQELEQQLEDRLMEHQTHYRGLRRGSSIDSLSTAAALRAMEPVSDLLREQHFLQSEVTYGGHSVSTNASSRSSSPGEGEGGAFEQKQGRYRASININPVPPPRPNTHTEEKDGQRERVGGGGEVVGGGEKPQVEGAAGEVGVGNLQDLIRQIRESVTQEVRREIYNELMATVAPKQTSMPSGQHSL